MKKLIKIKSISDVITNSSTEVFIIKMDDRFNSIKDKLNCYDDFVFFEDEEYVKKYIVQHIEDNDLWDLDHLFDNMDLGWNFRDVIEYCKDTAKKSAEEIYEFFKEQFNKLVGYAWVEEADDCTTRIIDELNSYGYGCVDRC